MIRTTSRAPEHGRASSRTLSAVQRRHGAAGAPQASPAARGSKGTAAATARTWGDGADGVGRRGGGRRGVGRLAFPLRRPLRTAAGETGDASRRADRGDAASHDRCADPAGRDRAAGQRRRATGADTGGRSQRPPAPGAPGAARSERGRVDRPTAWHEFAERREVAPTWKWLQADAEKARLAVVYAELLGPCKAEREEEWRW